ncbi:HD domain-containing protein [Streptomyces lateritius]
MSVRRLIGAALPGGEADGRRLAVWLAGVHDIGKATPGHGNGTCYPGRYDGRPPLIHARHPAAPAASTALARAR